MTDEEAFERYGDVPLHFSHYYNFLFIYKSAVLDNGDRITLQLGGTMEKVSALTVDVAEPLTPSLPIRGILWADLGGDCPCLRSYRPPASRYMLRVVLTH